MISLLHAIVFAVHIACVGLAGILPVACVFLERRATFCRDPWSGYAARRLGLHAIGLLTVGMLLGVLLIYLDSLHDTPGLSFLEAVQLAPEQRLWFGGAELVFYLICMGAYVAAWDWWSSRRFMQRIIALFAATNLMYHFPPLFVAINVMRMDPPEGPLDGADFRTLMFSAPIMARVIHYVLASTALAAGYVMLYASRAGAKMAASDSITDTPASSTSSVATSSSNGPGTGSVASNLSPAVVAAAANAAIRGAATMTATAARWALLAAMLQLPAGIWLLMELPHSHAQGLMGGDMLATLLFVASLLAALGMMHTLAAVSMGDQSHSAVYRSAGLLAAAVLLMAFTRERARSAEKPLPTSQATAFPHSTLQVESTGAK